MIKDRIRLAELREQMADLSGQTKLRNKKLEEEDLKMTTSNNDADVIRKYLYDGTEKLLKADNSV